MAITTALSTSFKQELLNKTHDLDTDTYKFALYTSSATLGASTTAYSATNEVSGTGYSAGGGSLTGGALATSGTTAYVDYADFTWSSSTITANGGNLYNSTASNKSVSTHAFGQDYSSNNGNFTLQFPTPDASNAIIRLA